MFDVCVTARAFGASISDMQLLSLRQLFGWLHPTSVSCVPSGVTAVADDGGGGGDGGIDATAARPTNDSMLALLRDAASVYALVRPLGNEQQFVHDCAELLPELRPYQRRAVAWMLQREHVPEYQCRHDAILHPLWSRIAIDANDQAIYWNQVCLFYCIRDTCEAQPLIGLDWIGLDWIGLDWIGLDLIGLDWIGLDWIGLDWIGLDWIASLPVHYRVITYHILIQCEEVLLRMKWGMCGVRTL
jgi:hypothetical protein